VARIQFALPLRYGGFALYRRYNPCAYLAALTALHSNVFPSPLLHRPHHQQRTHRLLSLLLRQRHLSLLPYAPSHSRPIQLQRSLNLTAFDHILFTAFPTYPPADRARLTALQARPSHWLSTPNRARPDLGQPVFLAGYQTPPALVVLPLLRLLTSWPAQDRSACPLFQARPNQDSSYSIGFCPWHLEPG